MRSWFFARPNRGAAWSAREEPVNGFRFVRRYRNHNAEERHPPSDLIVCTHGHNQLDRSTHRHPPAGRAGLRRGNYSLGFPTKLASLNATLPIASPVSLVSD